MATVVVVGKFRSAQEAIDMGDGVVYRWELVEQCWSRETGKYDRVWNIYLSERVSAWLSKQELSFRFSVTGTDFRLSYDAGKRGAAENVAMSLIYPQVVSI